MKIVISIPAYNEEKTLGKVIKEIRDVMALTKYQYIIQVIDDGSLDKTQEIALKSGAVVLKNKKNMGLMKTFIKELEKAISLKADIIVHTDADGQYEPSAIPKMIKKVEEGYDLVLGSRFKGKIKGMSFTKKLGNKAFARVLSKLTKTKLTDTTTGLRAFTKDVAKEISFINTFTYTQEQIIKSARQGFLITEVAVNTRPTRKSRLFKSPLQYALKAWINILRIYRDYEPLKFFGILGTIFISAGFLIGIWLLYLFIKQGFIGHIPSLILTMLLILTGIQIVTFGFLADMNRK